MKDFAAAAMLRLVRLGLVRLGLQREGLAGAAPAAASGALVPLQDKRQLLETLQQRHGPALLLRLGEAVHDADDDPTLTALIAARSAPELVERWQRLERFVHSQHRVVTLASGPTGCTLRHVSLRSGEAPSPAEDLLVFGVLVGLLQRIGTEDLRARFVGDRGYLCGFADQAHFTRSFKRFTAMTPAVYRAQFGVAAAATR